MIKTAGQQALDEFAKTVANEIKHLLETSMKTCIRCEHFDEKPELCRLAEKRPPARIIALGCEKFEEPIPF